MTYASDVSDEEWNLIEPFVKQGNMGRPREIDTRQVVNGIFYISRTGCQWRFLPVDFPNWKTVYDYYRNWRLDKIWDKIHDELRSKVRVAEGKKRNANSGNS